MDESEVIEMMANLGLDHGQAVKDIQAGMAFATGFAKVLIKLRKAEKDKRTCHLTSAESKIILDSLRLLRDKAKA